MIETIKSVSKNIKKKKIQLSKDPSHRMPWSVECLTPQLLKGNSIGSWGSLSVGADGKHLYCSVTGSALGQCHFVVDRHLL